MIARLLGVVLVALAWAAVAGLSAVAVMHGLGLQSWPFELVHHFIPASAIGAAAVFVFALSLRDLRLTIAAGSLFAFFLWALTVPGGTALSQPSPWLEATNAPPPSGAIPWASSADPGVSNAATPRQQISLITNNVFCQNRDPDGLARWLRTRPADVVALQEVPFFVDTALAELGDVYPYRARIVSDQNKPLRALRTCRGIILLSIFPITTASVYQPIEEAWPALIASIDVSAATRVWVAAIHASDPIRADGLVLRDQFLSRLALHLNTLHGPLVVLGDFNASPYTPAFRRFQAEAGLVASPWNPGSYPSRLGTFGIKIDHVLVRDADLLRLEPVAPVGSDHRPLRVAISLPATGAGALPDLAEAAATGEPVVGTCACRTTIERQGGIAERASLATLPKRRRLWPCSCHNVPALVLPTKAWKALFCPCPASCAFRCRMRD